MKVGSMQLSDAVGNDEIKRVEITSRIPSETDLRLLVIDPPDEWIYEVSDED